MSEQSPESASPSRRVKGKKKTHRRRADPPAAENSTPTPDATTEKKRRRRSKRMAEDETADVSDVSRTRAAKDAFRAGDAEASRALHAARSVTEELGHKRGGDYLKSMVYGAMDGLITTFAVVSAVVGGELSLGTVLIMGFANMLADGVSMGFGDYISSTAELKFARMERERELWECNNDIEAERQEMVELYAMKDGIDEDGARQIVDIISKNHETFVDIMMVEELGLMPPDPDDSPLKNGLVTFGAFILFGTIPLLAYIIQAIVVNEPTVKASVDATFGAAIALTGISMFTLGALTSRFTADPWYRAGAFTFLNGAIAAIFSYVVALVVQRAFGVEI